MTTPDRHLPQGAASPVDSGDAARTDLIARLANELFSEVRSVGPGPGAAAGSPTAYAPVHPIQEPLTAPQPTTVPHIRSDLLHPEALHPGIAFYGLTSANGTHPGPASVVPVPASMNISAPNPFVFDGASLRTAALGPSPTHGVASGLGLPGATPLGSPSEDNYYFLAPRTPLAPAALPRDPGDLACAGQPDRAAGLVYPGSQIAASGLDPEAIRRDFPILDQKVNGHRLVWLDNAATTQKPRTVIDITSRFYERDNSNIHRGAHTLAARATDAFEGAREKVQHFIGAKEAAEIIFLRGTTEGINLVAQSYGRKNIGRGDEILITTIEHHANIVPWQLLAQETGATLRVAPVNDRGELLLDQFTSLLSARTKIVAVAHVANALGTINPIEAIIPLAHSYGVPVLVDAAQSAPHIPLNVTALDADFLVLSGHKIFGPTGIGIVYGKRALLEDMPPWQGGGHMIKDVTFSRTVFQDTPWKFEAGTPDIAGAVGLGAAIDYLQGIGLPANAAYEHALLEYATEGLNRVPGLRIIGTAAAKASVLSFTIAGYDVTDVAKHLDSYGIAARSGHHCAQPALRRFGVEATVRASLALYNTHDDVDALLRALHRLPNR